MKSDKFTALFCVIVVCWLNASCQNPVNNSNTAINIQKMENSSAIKNPYYSRTDTTKLNVTDAEWKRILPDSIFQVGRLQGTERAFTGKFWDYEGLGSYYCAICGNALFRSDTKFSSSCGWPSFYEALRPNSVIYHTDNSYGMSRVEVVCGRCDSHLGHIFDDGPPPTGKRFCMNSVMLDFEPDK